MDLVGSRVSRRDVTGSPLLRKRKGGGLRSRAATGQDAGGGQGDEGSTFHDAPTPKSCRGFPSLENPLAEKPSASAFSRAEGARVAAGDLACATYRPAAIKTS